MKQFHPLLGDAVGLIVFGPLTRSNAHLVAKIFIFNQGADALGHQLLVIHGNQEAILTVCNNVLGAARALIGHHRQATLHCLDDNQGKSLDQRRESKN